MAFIKYDIVVKQKQINFLWLLGMNSKNKSI